MPHFKLTLCYDGTPFVGWQRQAAGASIQGLVEDALAILEGAPVTLSGAGRTDAGVHALAQVASVTLAREIDAATLVRALNAHLPPEIRIVGAQPVPPAFHARFSSTSKTYRYRIWNADVLSPMERAYVWHFPSPPLDVEAMDRAAQTLEGTHDFTSFQGAGAQTHTAERTIHASRVRRMTSDHGASGASSPLVVYEVVGSGFLRHMVRNIVGTLVEIGRGRRDAASMPGVLAARARGQAGETAPAAGLFLVRVSYSGPDL